MGRPAASFLVLAALAVASSVSGCGGAEEKPAEKPGIASKALWGRIYMGISVEQAGADVSLFEDPEKIAVDFAWDQALGKFIGWAIDCNEYGTKIKVKFHRIEEVETAGTLVGCPGAAQRRDEWMERFLRAGPRFRLSGQRLLLTAGNTTIALHESHGDRSSG